MLNKCFVVFATLLSTSFVFGDVTLTPKLKNQLLGQALEARKNAYVPSSKVSVGVALLTSSGIIYRGTNIENASNKVVCSAEHAAIAKAVSEGDRDYVALAIVAKGGGSLCEESCEVLREFNPKIIVIQGDEEGRLIREASLSLPN